MPLYTVIMEYAGGTYVSQVVSNSNKDVLDIWGASLKEKEFFNFGSKSKKILLEQIKETEIVEIKDTTNVWCSTFCIRNKIALVNIIQTEMAS